MNFERFYRAVHGGQSPFPWQREAARRLVEGDRFDAVDVPTGCGKTALLDAAVFAAAQGGRRRVFFIVDRRVVVDSAYERALKIADALARGAAGEERELAEIAETLGPLQVVRLRGGVHRDVAWVNHPERVTIVLSTVDQVGSRLLFRGYGASAREWHKHAGFVGHDALYLIDEAHISRPFVSMVRDARELGADVEVVEMTATQAGSHDQVLRLGDEDRAHAVLSKRLSAKKLASLKTVAKRGLARELANAAREVGSPGAVVGVVCNTVATARATFSLLERPAKRGGSAAECVLLTGRVRGVERNELLAQWLPRIRAGREASAQPDEGERSPVFVVATQTIEVGADLDFDALVTQAAPLSALRQRFGRLDRLGRHDTTRAVIVASDEDLGDKAAVYGQDIAATWEWLKARVADGVIDFGTSGFEAHLREASAPQEKTPYCPPLTASNLDVFVQTGDLAPEVDPSPWLHGPSRPVTSVQVLWRSDLEMEGPVAQWEERVAMVPPNMGEAVELSLGALRGWLGRGRLPSVADVEGTDVGPSGADDEGGPVGVVWRGPDQVAAAGLSDVRPGDTLILPAAVGGHDAYGWNPASTDPVRDIAELAALETHGAFTVRLSEASTEAWLRAVPREERSDLRPRLRDLFEAGRAYRSAVWDIDEEVGVDEEAKQEARERLLAALQSLDTHPFVQRLGRDPRFDAPASGGCYAVGPAVRDQYGTIQHGARVRLRDHLDAVGARARSVVRAVRGLSEAWREAVGEAAEKHDVGKAYGPFQLMLRGSMAGGGSELLAKSGFRRRSEARDAYEMSGLPKGFRHELASVARLGDAPELVRHLVGAHHGHGRPLFGACEDPTADGQWLGGPGHGWAGMFEALNEAVGPWTLAHLEGIVRAADVQISQEEEGR